MPIDLPIYQPQVQPGNTTPLRPVDDFSESALKGYQVGRVIAGIPQQQDALRLAQMKQNLEQQGQLFPSELSKNVAAARVATAGAPVAEAEAPVELAKIAATAPGAPDLALQQQNLEKAKTALGTAQTKVMTDWWNRPNAMQNMMTPQQVQDPQTHEVIGHYVFDPEKGGLQFKSYSDNFEWAGNDPNTHEPLLLNKKAGIFLDTKGQPYQGSTVAPKPTASTPTEEMGNYLGEKLATGDLSYDEIGKRSPMLQTLALQGADKYMKDNFGMTFDAAKNSGDFKYATNQQTKNVLNYMNSLTGLDGQGGNLKVLQDYSDKYPRFEMPALNNAKAWKDFQTGENPELKALKVAGVEVSDQFAKIMQGGTGNATSDKKIDQGLSVFDTSMGGPYLKSAIDSARLLLNNRGQEMIGDNVFLNKWYPGRGMGGSQQGVQGAKKPSESAPVQRSISASGKPIIMGPDGKWHYEQ